MRAVAAALALLALSCTAAPSQRDPAAYGSVRVALGPSLDLVHDWLPEHRAAVAAALEQLDGLGPDFVLTTEGEADVVVRAAALEGGCGSFSPGLAFVEVDGPCASQRGGSPAVARAACHEVAHWLTYSRWRWVGHVCRDPRDAADCHPAVTCPSGDCLLSPGLARPSKGPGYVEAFAEFADPAPAVEDLRLVRVLAGREP